MKVFKDPIKLLDWTPLDNVQITKDPKFAN